MPSAWDWESQTCGCVWCLGFPELPDCGSEGLDEMQGQCELVKSAAANLEDWDLSKHGQSFHLLKNMFFNFP